MRILVTGADGFIGRRACEVLEDRGHEVRRAVRHTAGRNRVVVGDLTKVTDWRPIVEGADVVLHLAARAHVLNDREADPEAAFRRANVDVTTQLAGAARTAGAARFVFVSSIGVNGAQTVDKPFTEADVPQPLEGYARSKLECEKLLGGINSPAFSVVVVRPTLVYGQCAKGNLLRILKLASSGLPLPLASVSNRRNLVGLDNLCSALALCTESPAASGQTFLLAEPEAWSTPEIFAAIYEGLGIRNRLFACPPFLLSRTAGLIGLGALYDKLCSSLEVSSARAMQVLQWKPRNSFREGMAEAARWFRTAYG
jgi:nucleoside-diphosphate-sugar epimerase